MSPVPWIVTVYTGLAPKHGPRDSFIVIELLSYVFSRGVWVGCQRIKRAMLLKSVVPTQKITRTRALGPDFGLLSSQTNAANGNIVRKTFGDMSGHPRGKIASPFLKKISQNQQCKTSRGNVTHKVKYLFWKNTSTRTNATVSPAKIRVGRFPPKDAVGFHCPLALTAKRYAAGREKRKIHPWTELRIFRGRLFFDIRQKIEKRRNLKF